MAAFLTAAAGACSPECAAALVSSPFSIPVIAAISIATAVGFAFSQAKDVKDDSSKLHKDGSLQDSNDADDGKSFVRVETFL